MTRIDLASALVKKLARVKVTNPPHSVGDSVILDNVNKVVGIRDNVLGVLPTKQTLMKWLVTLKQTNLLHSCTLMSLILIKKC